MIPKKLHYCWFGGKPLPDLAARCAASWKKLCPDYELVCWDEHTAPLDASLYVQQAYAAGEWAFVSDWVRLWALWRQGGIYLDTDVELLKPLDPFLARDAFFGFESPGKVCTCIIGARAGHPLIGELLKTYDDIPFLRPDGGYDKTTNVERATAFFLKKGLMPNGRRQTVGGAEIYPQDYFCPKDLATGKTSITENSCALHHFSASWMSSRQRFHTRIAQLIGPEWTGKFKKLRKR